MQEIFRDLLSWTNLKSIPTMWRPKCKVKNKHITQDSTNTVETHDSLLWDSQNVVLAEKSHNYGYLLFKFYIA